ncbi:MAG: sugar transferase [Limimaricola sp.]|uniref:sugar transferase n=1 Tax=Limimaricola sp. TaxID=2211665 RepID=UPI001D2EEF03|nr:sugar transferase [Limimaricola sp.]MBI1417900.1 sugar transferase [Limimaricola sp.]
MREAIEDFAISESAQRELKSQTAGTSLYASVGKRIFDIAFALALVPVVVPVVSVVWLVARKDGGPGFFGHKRVGKDGKEFICWKLRTMVPDAEEVLKDLLAADPGAAKEWAETHKLRKDPRITRIGRALRKSSLDELPQLWNVLRGDMSFVGPRPVPRDELRKYGAAIPAYCSLRPGITGLWQVSGRNDVSYDDRVAMDVGYASRSNFLLDLWIIIGTVGAVFRRTGH